MTGTTSSPAITPTTTPDRLGLYPLCLDGQESPIIGAPSLRLSLLVDAVNGTVTGQGEATPAELLVTNPEQQPYRITGITGTIHFTPGGPVGSSQIMSLTGESVVNFPPPAIGSMIVPFKASFAMAPDYSGHGGWSVGSIKVDDGTIKAVSCSG